MKQDDYFESFFYQASNSEASWAIAKVGSSSKSNRREQI
jgi:hypothetical protein